MTIEFTDRFKLDFSRLPREIQQRAERQLFRMASDPRHPSLRIKKMKGTSDIWEGRVTKEYRFTFQVEADRYVLRRIGTHDILKTP
jgi:mRNA-degrading endonuclease RelE of RelBE toxin-antitoxin system